MPRASAVPPGERYPRARTAQVRRGFGRVWVRTTADIEQPMSGMRPRKRERWQFRTLSPADAKSGPPNAPSPCSRSARSPVSVPWMRRVRTIRRISNGSCRTVLAGRVRSGRSGPPRLRRHDTGGTVRGHGREAWGPTRLRLLRPLHAQRPLRRLRTAGGGVPARPRGRRRGPGGADDAQLPPACRRPSRPFSAWERWWRNTTPCTRPANSPTPSRITRRGWPSCGMPPCRWWNGRRRPLPWSTSTPSTSRGKCR